MKKKKVLFLARRYAPHIGGVETHVQQLSRFLQQKNDQVTVVTERDDQSLPLQEKLDDVLVKRIALPHNQTSKWVIWWWVVRHSYLFVSADIIHIHDVFFWILPIYPVLKIFNKKIYMTFHGYEAPGPLTQKQIRWHRLAARFTKGNICVGGFHKKYYQVTPDFITYGGVDEEPKSHHQKLDPRAIAFVGRLAADTGVLAYLQAMKLLADQHFSYHLDIFGDGELRQECENFIQQHHLDVTLYGFTAHATNRFSAYPIVFASQYLTILSAMVNSCAVVSYADTPIKKDYLELTPFYEWITVTHSAAEIAAAVTQPKLMSKHGVGWAKKQTWEKLENQYLELWKK